jgi:hypothetical protein
MSSDLFLLVTHHSVQREEPKHIIVQRFFPLAHAIHARKLTERHHKQRRRNERNVSTEVNGRIFSKEVKVAMFQRKEERFQRKEEVFQRTEEEGTK